MKKFKKTIKKIANFTPLRFIVDIINIVGALTSAMMMLVFFFVILLFNEQVITNVGYIFLICVLTYGFSETLIKGFRFANENW